MAIPSFPTVARPDYNSYTQRIIKPARRTEFDGNAVSTRPRATVTRRAFSIGWRSMTQSDKDAVFTFFEKYQGFAFYYTPPLESVAILVVFGDDELSATAVSNDSTAPGSLRWRLSIELQEIGNNIIIANEAEETP